MVAGWTLGVSGAWAEAPLELLDRAQKDLQVHLDAAKAEQTAKAEQAAADDKSGRSPEELLALASRMEMAGNYPLQGAAQTLGQIRNALAVNRGWNALQYLQQLLAVNSNLPDDVRKDVDALNQAVSKER